MRLPTHSTLDDGPAFQWRDAIPAATIMLASLVTLWPLIASVGLLPPTGLLLFLAWKLIRPDALPVWAAAPLGLFDDLFSGQPLGSAMLLWMLSSILVDLIDQRLVFRDFWQDWLIAVTCIGFVLIGGRFVATRFDAHVDTALLVQILVSSLCYPLAASVVQRFARGRPT